MRRLLGIVLLLVMGLPLLACLEGQAHTGDLPICCRRSGVHHCTEMTAEGTGTLPHVRATCPAYPRGIAPAQGGLGLPGRHVWAQKALLRRDGAIVQAEAGFRIACGRARQKRGPPSQKI